MDAPFCLSDEQLQFAETVRRLGEEHFAASYLERATSTEFPEKEYKILAEAGLIGLGLPPEYEGEGADPIAIGLACEQLARSDINMAFFVFAASVVGTALAPRLRPHLARTLLPKVATGGTRFPCLAFTEPRGGSDAAGVRFRYERVDGGFVLTGEKTSITMASHADMAVVFATIDPGLGSNGISLFLVDLDEPTVSRQVFNDHGFRPIGRGALTFEGTFVPDDHLLGVEGEGLKSIFHLFDLSRPLLGLMAVGVAQGALALTAEYVKEREAFGQPISKYQGVSFVLAEHATRLEAARWLCYRALGLRAAGQPHAAEAAMCKWWPPELAVQAINDCIVLNGHVGWSGEMPYQQMLSDVSGLQIADGTPQIQKLVIARHILGRDAV